MRNEGVGRARGRVPRDIPHNFYKSSHWSRHVRVGLPPPPLIPLDKISGPPVGRIAPTFPRLGRAGDARVALQVRGHLGQPAQGLSDFSVQRRRRVGPGRAQEKFRRARCQQRPAGATADHGTLSTAAYHRDQIMLSTVRAREQRHSAGVPNRRQDLCWKNEINKCYF